MISSLYFNCAASLLTITVVLALRVRPLRLWPLVLILTHLGIVQLWVLITGLTFTMTVPTWWIVATIVNVAVIVWWSLARRMLLDELRVIQNRSIRSIRSTGAATTFWVAGLLLLSASVICFFTYLMGPTLPDVVLYYLEPPRTWMTEGGIAPHHWPDDRSHWPQGQSMFQIWWILPLRSMRFFAVVELYWFVLLVAVVRTAVMELTRNRFASLLAATTMITSPLFWGESFTGLNDIGFGALLVASVVLLSGVRSSNHRIAFGQLSFLMAVGVKPHVAVAAPVVGLLAVVCWFADRKRKDFHIRPVYLAVIAGGFMALIWPIQTAMLTGNPFYPAPFMIGDTMLLEGARRFDPTFEQSSDPGRIGFSNLVGNIALLPQFAWDESLWKRPFDVYECKYGVILVIVGLPGIALLLRPRCWRFAMPLLTIIVAMFFVVAPTNHALRLISIIPIALMIGCGLTMVRLFPWYTRRFRALISILMLGLFLLLALHTVWQVLPVEILEHWRDFGLEPMRMHSDDTDMYSHPTRTFD